MLKKRLLFVVGLCLLSFIGCKDDESQDVVTPNGHTTYHTPETSSARISAAITKETVTTDVNVTVRNTSGQFINGATVTIEGNTATTDVTGKASFEDLIVNSDYLFVVGEKDGFEKCQKTITPSANGTTNVELRLLANVPEQTFLSSTATELTFGGVKLDFPADAIEDANGNAYTGDVTVNTVYFDPSSDNFASTSPGDLVGINASDEVGALRSYGMLTVDLMDASGNTLNIAEGKTVDITMPAAADAPASIPLWHLNEEFGLWTEVGTATKIGGEYKATVSHFSSYNLDVWINDAIQSLDFIAKDQNGTILSNLSIQLEYTAWGGTSYKTIQTDSEGKFTLINVPSGEMSFTAAVGGADDQTLTKDLVNTSVAIELEFNSCDTCYTPMNISTTIEGSCEDEMGSVSLSVTSGKVPYTYGWSNGASTNVINANTGQYTVTVVDGTGASLVKNVEIIEDCFEVECVIGVVNIVRCNQPGQIIAIVDSIDISNVSYAWSDASTASVLNVPQGTGGIYTVTISEGVSEVAVCSLDVASPVFDVSLTKDGDLNQSSTSVDLSALPSIPSGSGVNYAYLWSNGSVNTQTVTVSSAGVYTVTVNNYNTQCSSVATIEVLQE